MKKATDTTPQHLKAKGRALWVGVQAEFAISDAQGLALLLVAAEALDRLEEARQILEKDGPMQPDRFGVMRKHPAAELEREARQGFLVALKQLGLDTGDEAEAPQMGRPPNVLPRAFRHA